MKTEVTLRVRGSLVKREVNAPNPSSGAAIAMLNLPPYIDRLHEVQIVQSIGHCGFRAAPDHTLTSGQNTYPRRA